MSVRCGGSCGIRHGITRRLRGWSATGPGIRGFFHVFDGVCLRSCRPRNTGSCARNVRFLRPSRHLHMQDASGLGFKTPELRKEPGTGGNPGRRRFRTVLRRRLWRRYGDPLTQTRLAGGLCRPVRQNRMGESAPGPFRRTPRSRWTQFPVHGTGVGCVAPAVLHLRRPARQPHLQRNSEVPWKSTGRSRCRPPLLPPH